MVENKYRDVQVSYYATGDDIKKIRYHFYSGSLTVALTKVLALMTLRLLFIATNLDHHNKAIHTPSSLKCTYVHSSSAILA